MAVLTAVKTAISSGLTYNVIDINVFHIASLRMRGYLLGCI